MQSHRKAENEEKSCTLSYERIVYAFTMRSIHTVKRETFANDKQSFANEQSKTYTLARKADAVWKIPFCKGHPTPERRSRTHSGGLKIALSLSLTFVKTRRSASGPLKVSDI